MPSATYPSMRSLCLDATDDLLQGNLSHERARASNAQWAEEYNDWRKADLSRDEWGYIWPDGIYNGLRGTDDRLCVLVVIGLNARGEKHFLAIEDGVRESTQSWREVLLGPKSRGLSTPKLAIGDGAHNSLVNRCLSAHTETQQFSAFELLPSITILITGCHAHTSASLSISNLIASH